MKTRAKEKSKEVRQEAEASSHTCPSGKIRPAIVWKNNVKRGGTRIKSI
jgi:hypothetical protein